MSSGAVAWRIETERLILRPWRPEDAPALKAAVDSSLDHLRPWMPWAQHEPTPVEDKVEMIERWQLSFALGRELPYGMLERDDVTAAGSTGLHDRVDKTAREIGYWVRRDLEGQGLVTESTAALTKVAFEVMGLERIEIRCDPANVRSAAVPRRLGFELVEVVPATAPDVHEGRTETMVWSLSGADYPPSPCAAARIEVWGRDGASLRVS